MPDAPVIEVDANYDPFSGEENPKSQKDVFERFERENVSNWERLYTAIERENTTTSTGQERKFFQVKNKYIVCPVKSGLMIIDQKRAHERILFEKYLEKLNHNQSVSQVELFPVSIELNPADIFILKEFQEYIRLLGFNIIYSGNTISRTGRPAENSSSDPVEMLEILLEEYKKTKSDPSTGLREKIAAAMAEAAAIPYGKALLKNEMEESL